MSENIIERQKITNLNPVSKGIAESEVQLLAATYKHLRVYIDLFSCFVELTDTVTNMPLSVNEKCMEAQTFLRILMLLSLSLYPILFTFFCLFNGVVQ